MAYCNLDPQIKEKALELLELGVKRPFIQQELGVGRTTLWRWSTEEKTPQTRGVLKVSQIRAFRDRLAEGVPLKQLSRETGYGRRILRRCRDDERFAEATFEYDPVFEYDETDLLDRAVVAHHLCREATPGERLDLLFAVIADQDPIEPVTKAGYGRKLRT